MFQFIIVKDEAPMRRALVGCDQRGAQPYRRVPACFAAVQRFEQWATVCQGSGNTVLRALQ
jgi:hypothetical protein